MMQIIYCECGESSMLGGRCIGCGRVRPSSKEVIKQITKNKEEYAKLLNELDKTRKLEEEDENMC